MAKEVGAPAFADADVQRYRQVERALWDHYGLTPTQRFVQLDSPAVGLRVLEVGSGEPVLFIHGLVGPGGWAPLVRQLAGFRCLILDRPGWGLSSAVDYTKHDYKNLVADLLSGTLSALGVDRTHVVGGSIGDVWALRLAAAHPSRVDRIVLLGQAPILSEIRAGMFFKLLASPVGTLMVRAMQKPGTVPATMRRIGHGANLDSGRMPAQYVQWREALHRHTGSLRSERAMLQAMVNWRGWRPGVTFEDAELAGIQQPTLYVYGTGDPVGTVHSMKRTVDLLPHADAHIIEGGSHEPWFDDPIQVGARVSQFLTS